VYGTDYSALQFQQKYKGMSVAEYIQKFPDGEYFDEETSYWGSEIVEVGDNIPLAFRNFIRENIQDYDHAKDHDYFLEDEVI
jgi:hypothetical protein